MEAVRRGANKSVDELTGLLPTFRVGTAERITSAPRSAGRSIRIGRATFDGPQYDLGVIEHAFHFIQFVRAPAPVLGKFVLEGGPDHASRWVLFVDLLAERI